MDFISAYDGELVSAGIAIVISFLVWAFRPRVRLVWGLSHGFVHSVLVNNEEEKEAKSVQISTTSHLVTNAGRKTAENVEVTFNYKPDSIEIWPQRDYEISENPDKRYIIKFKTLAPKEQYSINLLTLRVATPDLLTVRCDEIMGRELNLTTVQKFSRPIEYIFLILMFLGLVASIYILIQFVGWFATLAKSSVAYASQHIS